MKMKTSINLDSFRQELKATQETLNKATRPAAQAGAQIVYDRARAIVAAEFVSKKPHYFYGTNKKYGPFNPGTLYNSIYQAFSEDNSFSDVSTYHVSWNATKAPYGGVVEFGGPEYPSHSFIGRALKETRSAVREAMKQRYIEEISKK